MMTYPVVTIRSIEKGLTKAMACYASLFTSNQIAEWERQQKAGSSHNNGTSNIKMGDPIPQSMEQTFKALISKAKKQRSQARKGETAAPQEKEGSAEGNGNKESVEENAEEAQSVGEGKVDPSSEIPTGPVAAMRVMASDVTIEDKECPSSPQVASAPVVVPPPPPPSVDEPPPPLTLMDQEPPNLANPLEGTNATTPPMPAAVPTQSDTPSAIAAPAAATATSAQYAMADELRVSKRGRGHEVVELLSEDDNTRDGSLGVEGAEAGPATTNDSSGNGDWHCSICTFRNVQGVSECEMCGSRPGAYSRDGVRKRQKSLLESISSPKPTTATATITHR